MTRVALAGVALSLLVSLVLLPGSAHSQTARSSPETASAETVVHLFWDAFNRAAWSELDVAFAAEECGQIFMQPAATIESRVDNQRLFFVI